MFGYSGNRRKNAEIWEKKMDKDKQTLWILAVIFIGLRNILWKLWLFIKLNMLQGWSSEAPSKDQIHNLVIIIEEISLLTIDLNIY